MSTPGTAGQEPPFSVGWRRTSPSDLKWEEKADQLEFDALTRVRSAAEKWAASQAAIIGLLGTIMLVKGREDIGELTTLNQVVVALLLAGALLLALVAAYLTALAAQGTPEQVQWPSGPRLRAWEREQALQAKKRLKLSRILTVLTVACLVLAVAVTWFGDAKKETSSPSVVVLRADGAAVCGELAAGADGALTVKPAKGEPLPVTGSDVSSLTAVDGCP